MSSAAHAYAQVATGRHDHAAYRGGETMGASSALAAISLADAISSVSVRSALQPALPQSDDEEDFLDDPELVANMEPEDLRLLRSLPPPGPAGRLKPRSASLARFYYHLNRCLDRIPGVMDCVMRGLGPTLVMLAWFLFGTCAFVFFGYIVPVRDWSILTWPGAVIIPFGLFLLFQVYYNHIMAVFVKPGGVPKDWHVPHDIRQIIREENATIVRGEGFSKNCKSCVQPKAARMHHCHVCRTCVLRMDHHCPWVGQCVGWRNYRYFYNFLFWLEIGCMYLVCCTLPLIGWPDEEQFIRLYTKHPDARLFTMNEAPIFFILVLTASALVAVGGMLALHTYLAVTNQTTIEMYHNSKKQKQAKRRGEPWFNPYDLGYRRNWLAILGSGCGGFVVASLFSRPLGLARLEGDGIHFEMNPKMAVDCYSPTRLEVVIAV